ncbi:hypothetical protein [Dyella mobilis]|uniref:Uncharacterized protein n=1 Tax=Dyella mobilis TaxID=1849582 RepID=A0ABS2KKZ0_9GAMM|nr:hypothetical protein [Dyella mobilis]MBM7131827.1 hypothetical protein [Dyella mobilis]GLQ96194.1 hypothetical protein GCM10007863_06120 [Dyella mobilis]
MTTRDTTEGLSGLSHQVGACTTECTNAAGRAVDTHLQTRLASLAGQVDAMALRIDAYAHAGKSTASSTVVALTQQAVAAAAAMRNAQGDDGIYQAMPLMQQLFGALEQAFPALS